VGARDVHRTRQRAQPVNRPHSLPLNPADERPRDRGEAQILLTTSDHPSAGMFDFIGDLLRMLPNATYYKRQGLELKKMCKWGTKNEFTHCMVINENRKEVNGLVLIYLPYGPTAHFRISNLVLSKVRAAPTTLPHPNESLQRGALAAVVRSLSRTNGRSRPSLLSLQWCIVAPYSRWAEVTQAIRNHGKPTRHRPELILNNFTTRIGHRVGRLFASLYPFNPEFRGRRVVTFHNQRDFIFVRQHRYIFETREDGKVRARWARALALSTLENNTTGRVGLFLMLN